MIREEIEGEKRVTYKIPTLNIIKTLIFFFNPIFNLSNHGTGKIKTITS